jgi:hypothetical protein
MTKPNIPQDPNDNNPFADVPLIFSYTRKQAIDDGVLVDLTAWAKETGFSIPVACTAAVWHDFVVPPGPMKQWGQSERGRAHDLLVMLFFAIRSRKTKPPVEGEDLLFYEVLFQQEPGKTITVKFKAICGPGDDGEPVLTVLRPDED